MIHPSDGLICPSGARSQEIPMSGESAKRVFFVEMPRQPVKLR
jgi:hypothetical protein